MSRSYRKNLILTSSGSKYRKFAKRQANKKIRRACSVPDHKKYKCFYESWDISDYVYRYEKGDTSRIWRIKNK